MSREQLIDDLVTFMSLSKSTGDTRLPLSYFDEAESIDARVSEAGDTIVFMLPSGTVRSNQHPLLTYRPELVREHVDISFVESRKLAGTDGSDPVRYRVSRVREVPHAFLKGKKTINGYPALTFSRTFSVSIGDIEHDGSFFGACVDYVGWSNGSWQGSEKYGNGSLDRAKWEGIWRAASCGIASMLLRRFLWRVSLRVDDGPSVSFSTDPEGVRALVRLRDIPAGKQRRAALVHWVREHWRKSPDPQRQDLSRVAEHLRGATEFTWNGLRGRVVPSVADQEWAVAVAR